jgi:ABC-2 type transport system permease protein
MHGFKLCDVYETEFPLYKLGGSAINIVVRELKANLKSLIIWSSIIVLYIYMGMTEFSSYAGNKDMLDLLDTFPKALMDAFSFSNFNLTTVSGFMGVMISLYAIILNIHAALIGSSIISKEERDKTVEFLLVMPVKREQVLTSKIIAAFLNCLCLLAVTAAASYTGAMRYLPEKDFTKFLSLCICSMFLMQMIFLSVGILLGSALKQYKRAGYLSITIVVAAYFLSIAIGLSSKLDFLKYITPFKYQEPVKILHELRLDIWFILLSVGITVICTAVAYMTYKKRDLYI